MAYIGFIVYLVFGQPAAQATAFPTLKHCEAAIEKAKQSIEDTEGVTFVRGACLQKG